MKLFTKQNHHNKLFNKLNLSPILFNKQMPMGVHQVHYNHNDDHRVKANNLEIARHHRR